LDYFKKQFTDLFDLSAEITMDLPLIMLVGQQKLYIENHKGISLYMSDKIKIRVKPGYVIITGSELVIGEIKTENLSISGQISGIFYEKG
jgi:sporulation protein YqfC